MSFTQAGAAESLDQFTDQTLYLGLSTTTPTSTGTNYTEPVGNNYSRATVLASAWATAIAGSPASITTSSAVSMAVPSGSWGTCTHFGLSDAASAGNLWRFGALSSSITPDAATTALTVTPTLNQSL